MSWKVPDLSDYLVAVGKNGGPIGECGEERDGLDNTMLWGGSEGDTLAMTREARRARPC